MKATNKKEKWQRVIDEGYYCEVSSTMSSGRVITNIIKLNQEHLSRILEGGIRCKILREKGIKQPHFQGDDIPELTSKVLIYTAENCTFFSYAYPDTTDWSEIVAYIEV